MSKKTGATVGISLGTRVMGVAVILEGTLLVWEIKRFTGAWSEMKRKKIITVVGSIISRYHVSGIAIRVPHQSRSSLALSSLIRDIKETYQKRNIVVLTGEDFRTRMLLRDKWNKRNRARYLVDIFPELSALTHPYYDKLFEAVAAALISLDKKGES